MANTGFKNVLTLRKYINGNATSETKPNTVGDPDYIAPYEDAVACPVNAEPTTQAPTTTTTTAAPTTTTTTAAPRYAYNTSAEEGDGAATLEASCYISANYVLFADALFDDIAIGTKIYTSATGPLFAGQSKWYAIAATGSIATQSIAIDNSGNVINVADCEDSYNFYEGTTLNFAAGELDANPKTQTISGIVQVKGQPKTFKVRVLMDFGVGNIATGKLEVLGTEIQAVTTTTGIPTYSTQTITIQPGSYQYTVTGILDVTSPRTSGNINVQVIEQV